MSYSRWSHSHWYTFWLVYPSYERDEQRFEICGECVFTYKELISDLEQCLRTTQKIDTEDCEERRATAEQIDELRQYMRYFIRDVDTDEHIIYYEKLKNEDLSGDLNHLDEIEYFIKDYWDEEYNSEIREALKVLRCKHENLPLLINIKTKLGKIVLERRLKSRKESG